ncbi:hypothetical protein [Nucisporomicrobium flavum]|uniref:hypothetical protein n=1 Tax=Nucisporomicrobium flavum TaxID=2785915 RepID=UPI0018F644A2|nr:hypothetical protein [Nucisporomicrobium flavum]
MNDNTDVTTEQTATPAGRPLRTAARRLSHPVVNISGLLAAHVAALAVLEKTPLLALLSLH